MVSLITSPSVLFEFVFNPYAVLSLVAATINIILFYLIVSKGLQVSASRWFGLVLITLIVWGLAEALSRFSATAVAADFWGVAGMLGWVFVGPTFFAFTLIYIGRENFLSRLTTQLLLFGPSFFFLLLGWTTNLINNRYLEQYEKVFYGWSSPSTSDVTPLFWVVILWIDILLVSAVVLLIRYWLSVKDQKKRRQTSIFIIAVLVPIVGGSITNGILPIFNIRIFPAAVLLTSVMSLGVTYAILRYKLFVINPATVVINIVETINEILVVMNPDHFIEFVNSAVTTTLGYKKEELIGQHMRKLIGSDWQVFKDKVLQQLDAGESVSGVELNFEGANGRKIPVSFSATLLRDEKGQVFGEVGVATDVRKIRTLFADVAAERNKLNTMMESIADGVLALDFSGKVIMVNPAALSMLGLNKSDFLGAHLDEALTLYEGDEKLPVASLLPKGVPASDLLITAKNNVRVVIRFGFGKQIFVNLTSSAIKEGAEVGLGAIITMNDVSKEKELEEMKLDFVSMAAHELRTPLTAIRGYLSVLQEEVASSLSREQKSFLDKAFISSSQLAALVENLLSVSRIERGAMKLEIGPTSWKMVLNEAVTNFQPLAKEKGIKLTLTCPDNLPAVLVDKFRINEVLSNLIGNALTYTRPGGGVKVSAEESRAEVTTHVKDTGQGIPESALPKLFTKFFRVSGVLEQGSKGTGLGLYISKAIVDLHKGRIWVKSTTGEGSVFSFTVPAASEVAPSTSPAFSAPSRLPKRRSSLPKVGENRRFFKTTSS